METIVTILLIISVIAYFVSREKDKPEDPPENPVEPPDDTVVRPVPPVQDGEKVYILRDGVKEEGTVKVMPQGLQVFDGSGKLTLDLGHRVAKVLGRRELQGSGSISVTEGKVWFVMVNRPEITDVDWNSGHQDDPMPSIYIKDNKIVWSDINENSATIVYGVY